MIGNGGAASTLTSMKQPQQLVLSILLVCIVVTNTAQAFSFVKLARQMGQIVGRSVDPEWKKIPQEFQKGWEEGETEARYRNAKQMEAVVDDEDDDSVEKEEEVIVKKED